MRAILVGPPRNRARLRAQLDGAAVEIVGEFLTLAAARSSSAHADAIVIATTAGPRDGSRPAFALDEDAEVAEPLTPREIQVLELLAEGRSNKAIAAALAISDQTVKYHVSSISGKLGAVNRTDAVRRAVRRGLISL